MQPALTAQERTLLWSLAGRFAPETRAYGDSEREECLRLVEEAVAERDEALRRKLRLFLFAVRWVPALRWGRPFERLSAERQDAVLRRLQGCRSAPLRAGLWGVRTMVFLGVYGRPAAAERLGWRYP